LNAAEAANPITVMIANNAMQAAAARQAVPNINSTLAWPISDWSSSASPSMITNARTDVQKPKLTNLPRMRLAGEGVLTGSSGLTHADRKRNIPGWPLHTLELGSLLHCRNKGGH
jgi:hypothetical protein